MYLHAKTNFILYLRLRSRSKLRRLTLMCVSFSSTVRALTGQSWRSTHRRWSIFLCWTSRCQTLGRATSSLALKWDLSVSKDKHKHTENNTCKHSHAHTRMHLERHYYDKPTCPVICKLTCKWYKSHIPTQTHTLVYAEAVVRQTHSLSCTAGESDIPQQVKDDQKEKRRKVRKTCEEEETSTGSVTVRKKPGGRQQQEADLRWRASRQPEAWHPWLQPPPFHSSLLPADTLFIPTHPFCSTSPSPSSQKGSQSAFVSTFTLQAAWLTFFYLMMSHSSCSFL